MLFSYIWSVVPRCSALFLKEPFDDMLVSDS